MRHKRGPPPMTGRPPFKPAALFTIHRFSPSSSLCRTPFIPCRPPFLPPPTNLREFTPVAGQHPRKCRLERLLPDACWSVGPKCANGAASKNWERGEKNMWTIDGRSVLTIGNFFYFCGEEFREALAGTERWYNRSNCYRVKVRFSAAEDCIYYGVLRCVSL